MRRVAIFLGVLIMILNANSIKTIDDIRANFSESRKNIDSMNRSKVELNELSTEGAEATIYKQNKEIKLIEVKAYMEMGNAKDEYYFKDGKLFFVYTKEENYNAPPTTKFFDESKIEISENRYYFIDNKLVKWLKDKKIVPKSSKDYIKTQNQILEFSNFLLKKVN